MACSLYEGIMLLLLLLLLLLMMMMMMMMMMIIIMMPLFILTRVTWCLLRDKNDEVAGTL
jgi:hypothetical protein